MFALQFFRDTTAKISSQNFFMSSAIFLRHYVLPNIYAPNPIRYLNSKTSGIFCTRIRLTLDNAGIEHNIKAKDMHVTYTVGHLQVLWYGVAIAGKNATLSSCRTSHLSVCTFYAKLCLGTCIKCISWMPDLFAMECRRRHCIIEILGKRNF